MSTVLPFPNPNPQPMPRLNNNGAFSAMRPGMATGYSAALGGLQGNFGPKPEPLPYPTFQPPNSHQGAGDAFVAGPKKTSFPSPVADSIGYSEIPELLQSRRIAGVTIFQDPNSISHLPVAKVLMQPNEMGISEERALELPRGIEEFTQDLRQAHVPYKFDSMEKEGLGKVAEVASNMAVELFAPFALIALTGVIGFKFANVWPEMQAKKAMQAAFHASQKELGEVKHKLSDIMGNYEKPVQEHIQQFRDGNLNVLLGQGLPGIGKTHGFLSLAQDIAKNNPGTLILDVKEGNSGNTMRALLNDIYSGDKEKATTAIKFLSKEKGQKIEEILLYADEIDGLPPAEMSALLTNGIGNPASAGITNLPKLRVLGTTNGIPAFVSDNKTNSRLVFDYIKPPEVAVTAKVLDQALRAEMKDKAALLPADLLKTIETVFQEYPGYSPRTLVTRIASGMLQEPQMKNALQSGKALGADEVKAALANRLNGISLTDSEMAALLIQRVAAKVQQSRQPLHPEHGINQLWRDLHEKAEGLTRGMSTTVSLNGKSAKQTMDRLLQSQSVDYVKDSMQLENTATDVVKKLKAQRLQAFTHITDNLAHEQSIIHGFSDFLTRSAKKAGTELEAFTKDSPAQKEGLANIKQLDKLKQNLESMDRTGPAADSLRSAARIYGHQLENAPEDDLLTPEKMDVLYKRALTHPHPEYTADNDYGVGSLNAQNYVPLFRHLQNLKTNLLDKA